MILAVRKSCRFICAKETVEDEGCWVVAVSVSAKNLIGFYAYKTIYGFDGRRHNSKQCNRGELSAPSRFVLAYTGLPPTLVQGRPDAVEKLRLVAK